MRLAGRIDENNSGSWLSRVRKYAATAFQGIQKDGDEDERSLGKVGDGCAFFEKPMKHGGFTTIICNQVIYTH